MHLKPVDELENYQSVVHNFATADFRIHNLVEAWVWPLALFPMGHQFTVTKEIHGRLDSEIDRAECELEVELSDPYLSCELPDNRGQIKIFGYPTGSLASPTSTYRKGTR
jgi:hypothetical protein